MKNEYNVCDCFVVMEAINVSSWLGDFYGSFFLFKQNKANVPTTEKNFLLAPVVMHEPKRTEEKLSKKKNGDNNQLRANKLPRYDDIIVSFDSNGRPISELSEKYDAVGIVEFQGIADKALNGLNAVDPYFKKVIHYLYTEKYADKNDKIISNNVRELYPIILSILQQTFFNNDIDFDAKCYKESVEEWLNSNPTAVNITLINETIKFVKKIEYVKKIDSAKKWRKKTFKHEFFYRLPSDNDIKAMLSNLELAQMFYAHYLVLEQITKLYRDYNDGNKENIPNELLNLFDLVTINKLVSMYYYVCSKTYKVSKKSKKFYEVTCVHIKEKYKELFSLIDESLNKSPIFH